MDAHACFLGFQYRKDYKLTVQKFTYSWATNRMGTVWNIIKHPCADAFQNSRGSEFNHYPAVTTFSLPNMDNIILICYTIQIVAAVIPQHQFTLVQNRMMALIPAQ